MDHTLIPNYSKKILTSILNSYKLGVENGNIGKTEKLRNKFSRHSQNCFVWFFLENYQNTDGIKATIEKICQLEEDFKKEYELAQGFDCDSLTNFDIAAEQMLVNYQRDRPLAKNSQRYENLAKDIDDIQQALVATFNQADATQNIMTEVDGMQMQSTMTSIDPISKQRITDPVRNRTCRHVYQKETILVHIRQAQSGQARFVSIIFSKA